MKIFGMETKKLSLWLVVILAAGTLISGVFLLASGLPASIRSGEEWPAVREGSGSGFIIDEYREFPTEGLQGLDIHLGFENASIGTADGDFITVRYFGTAQPAGDAEGVFHTEVSGGVLSVESRWGGVPVRNGRITLELGIPEDTSLSFNFVGGSGSLEAGELSLADIDVRLGSGNIDIVDLAAASVSMKVGSGNITAVDCLLERGRLETGSGTLNLNDVRSAGNLELEAMSGRISGDDVSAAMIEGRVGSGNVALTDVSGSFRMKSGSGNLDVMFLAPGNDVELSAGSGRIEVGLPPDTEFRLDARTGSGSISSDFPVTVSGSMNNRNLEGVAGSGGNRNVVLNASSGNIVLKETPVQ